MERILIIGCPGSGKTTLARKLGEKLKLPVVHLDRLWWTGNWENVTREEFDARLSEELEKPRWIIDGNYNRTMPQRLEKCDTVIYLDFNLFVCLWGSVKRVIRGTEKPDRIWAATARSGLIRNFCTGSGIITKTTGRRTTAGFGKQREFRYTF